MGEGVGPSDDDIGCRGRANEEGPGMSDASSISPGSVSRLLGGLREGDEEAVRQLWRRYFQPLVRLAHGRLSAQGPTKWRSAQQKL